MMNEVEFQSSEELMHADSALLAELGEYLGEHGADVARLSRRLYKATSCGAWLAVDEKGLHVGSIVEGSDDDCDTHTLTVSGYLGMVEGDLATWLDAAIASIEAEADEIWREWNE